MLLKSRVQRVLNGERSERVTAPLRWIARRNFVKSAEATGFDVLPPQEETIQNLTNLRFNQISGGLIFTFNKF